MKTKFGDKLAEVLTAIKEGRPVDIEEARVLFNQLDDKIEKVSGWLREEDGDPGFDKVHAQSIEFMNALNGLKMSQAGYLYNDVLWNLVGVSDEKLQVGIRAADGKFLAAGGGLVIDERGMVGDVGSVRLYSESATTIQANGYISGVGYGMVNILGVSNELTNGDFEDGDFTDWTETGTPVIEETEVLEGSYSAKVDSSNYISHTFDTAIFDYEWYMVKLFFKKTDAAHTLRITCDGNNFDFGSTYVADRWHMALIVFQAEGTDAPVVDIKTTDANGVYVDDVICDRVFLSSLGTNGTDTYIKTSVGSLIVTSNIEARGIHIKGNHQVGQFKSSYTHNIADDDVVVFILEETGRVFVQGQETGGSTFYVDFLQNGNTPTAIHTGSATTLTTGVLTGTTGTDGNLTVSIQNVGDERGMYIENRTGAARNFHVHYE